MPLNQNKRILIVGLGMSAPFLKNHTLVHSQNATLSISGTYASPLKYDGEGSLTLDYQHTMHGTDKHDNV